MDNLVKMVISFGVGFFTARYILLGKYKNDYIKVEQEAIDKTQNKLHDLLKEVYPEAPDTEIAEVVMKVTTDEGEEVITAPTQVLNATGRQEMMHTNDYAKYM